MWFWVYNPLKATKTPSSSSGKSPIVSKTVLLSSSARHPLTHILLWRNWALKETHHLIDGRIGHPKIFIRLFCVKKYGERNDRRINIPTRPTSGPGIFEANRLKRPFSVLLAALVISFLAFGEAGVCLSEACETDIVSPRLVVSNDW